MPAVPQPNNADNADNASIVAVATGDDARLPHINGQ